MAVSILPITWGIGFAGTVWIAAGMLLSVAYLLCWDADRVWRATAILVGASSAPPIRGRVHALERLGWWLGGASGLALLLVACGLLPRTLTRELFYAGIVAFALIVSGWILTLVAEAFAIRVATSSTVGDTVSNDTAVDSTNGR